MTHIIRRHAFDSNSKNISRFLPGIGKKEIAELANEVCKKAPSWTIGKNGLLEAVVDVGRDIGTKRECGLPTTFLKVVLNKNLLHTSHPF